MPVMYSFMMLTDVFVLLRNTIQKASMGDDHLNYGSDQYGDEENYAKTIEDEFSALIDKISSVGSITSWYDANYLVWFSS